MTVKELGHVVLYVSDVERSAAFYRDVLGLGAGLPRPRRACRWPPSPRDGPTTSCCSSRWATEATPQPRGRHLGLYHIGLKVGDSDEELREVVRRLHEAEVTVVGASDHTVTHSLYVLDPDGNEIELYIDVPGVDWKARPEPDHGPDQAAGPLIPGTQGPPPPRR